MTVGQGSRSYEGVNYLVRPSKQVERKLFLEALTRLAKHGYSISDYTYVGFGSVYYADFILFHKYLYIDDMVCVEHADIGPRMRFNRPYKFIRLQLKEFSEVIPTLSTKKKYLVWLDYDYSLNPDILADVDGCVQKLGPGSILIVTVDAEPRLSTEAEGIGLSESGQEEEFLRIMQRDFGAYVPQGIHASGITRRDLPGLLVRILRARVTSSLTTRKELAFLELFNYRYADGAQMVTLGGILDDRGNLSTLEKKLGKAGMRRATQAAAPAEPQLISVPPLTPREKAWLDGQIDKKRAPLRSGRLGLDKKLLRNYARFYRYYPSYYEALL